MLTDDAGTTPYGHWEINLAGTLEHSRASRTYELPLADANYGISPRAQLKWEFPWIWQQTPGSSTVGGIGDSTVGCRYRFLDEDHKKPAISTYPQLSFNNSSSSVHRGLVDRQTTFFLPVEVQKDLGAVSLNLEAGYNFHWGGADEWVWGIVAGREINSRWEMMLEYHTDARTGFREAVRVVDVGTRYRLGPHHILLLNVGTGASGPPDERPSLIAYLGVQLAY